MDDTLALVAIVKNETAYLLEWIAHYRTIGVRNIVLYDNETSDDPHDLLGRLRDGGVISLVRWPTVESASPQLSAYADALARFGDRFAFMAYFDLDEFLRPAPGASIVPWLAALPDDVGAVAVNQQIYGSSLRRNREPGLIVERFRLAAVDSYPEHLWVKSIYRTASVERIASSHRGILRQGRYILPNGQPAFAGEAFSDQASEIDFSVFRLNHYIIKSLEEFMIKRARGGAAAMTAAARLARYEKMGFFHNRDRHVNRVLHTALSDRASAIRAEMDHLASQLDLRAEWRSAYGLDACAIGGEEPSQP